MKRRNVGDEEGEGGKGGLPVQWFTGYFCAVPGCATEFTEGVGTSCTDDELGEFVGGDGGMLTGGTGTVDCRYGLFVEFLFYETDVASYHVRIFREDEFQCRGEVSEWMKNYPAY